MDQETRKAAIARAAALLGADPAAAEREAMAVRRAAPHDPNATLILASALRRQGRAPEAIPILEALAREFPRAPPTHYELGMSLADTGRVDDAVAALRWATEIDPEYAEAWRALGALLFDAGDARGAEAAFAEHDRALVREPHLKGAALALYRGGADQAVGILQPIVSANPGDLAAASLLAEAHLRAAQPAAAARSSSGCWSRRQMTRARGSGWRARSSANSAPRRRWRTCRACSRQNRRTRRSRTSWPVR